MNSTELVWFQKHLDHAVLPRSPFHPVCSQTLPFSVTLVLSWLGFHGDGESFSRQVVNSQGLVLAMGFSTYFRELNQLLQETKETRGGEGLKESLSRRLFSECLWICVRAVMFLSCPQFMYCSSSCSQLLLKRCIYLSVNQTYCCIIYCKRIFVKGGNA